MQSYIFYHSSTLNDYHERFLKTYNKIVSSGLIDAVDKIYVSLNGDMSNAPKFKVHPKIEVISLSPVMFSNESLTTNYIREFCRNLESEANILYIHSKGVTKCDSVPVNSWIAYMEYFLIEEWKECFKALEEMNTVGVNKQDAPGFGLHYSGNFWWAKSSYIKQLPTCDTTDYYSSEKWLLSLGKNDTYKSLFTSGVNHYHEEFPPSKYIKS